MRHSPVNEIKITRIPQSNCWTKDNRHLLLLCCFCSSCPRPAAFTTPPHSSFLLPLALNMMAVIASQFADWFICYFQFSFKIFPPLLCHNNRGTVVLFSPAHWKNLLALAKSAFVAVVVVDSKREEVAQNTIWLSNKSHHNFILIPFYCCIAIPLLVLILCLLLGLWRKWLNAKTRAQQM